MCRAKVLPMTTADGLETEDVGISGIKKEIKPPGGPVLWRVKLTNIPPEVPITKQLNQGKPHLILDILHAMKVGLMCSVKE